MKIHIAQRFLVYVLAILLLSSCGEELNERFRPVPSAFGRLNQLVIIADEELWEGAVGDSLRYYYGSAYPILPQPEPILDLVHYTPADLDAQVMRRELRTYLIVANLSDDDSSTAKLIRNDLSEEKLSQARQKEGSNVTIGRDKWANGQTLIYQYAWSQEELIDNIRDAFPTIYQRIENMEEDRIDATIFFQGGNPKVQKEVKEKTGADIRIPHDYFIAVSDEDVIWIRKETDDLSSNLLIHKLAYEDQQQLSREGIKAIRDSLGRKYIQSTLPDTYMRINDVDLPMFTEATTINDRYALEARGIWEIENDFMGGSFVSYLIHNPEKQELLFIDGFVHAPGKKKRDYMEHLEYIISTTEF